MHHCMKPGILMLQNQEAKPQKYLFESICYGDFIGMHSISRHRLLMLNTALRAGTMKSMFCTATQSSV